MRKLIFSTLTLLALAIFFPSALGATVVNDSNTRELSSGPASTLASAKISTTVTAALQAAPTTRALIIMSEQADVSAADNLPTKLAKGRYVLRTLRATAKRTQANVRALLEQRHIPYRAYYIANVISVEKLDARTAAQIAALPQVGRISSNPTVHFSAPVSEVHSAESQAPTAIEWNLKKIHAPRMWRKGFEGKGMVVAGADTGVQWDHPALQSKYRGYNNRTLQVNNAYNWWDAIHEDIDGSSNICGYNLSAPCDDYGHGTHTMGTMVGSDSENEIGVAPKAKWIACRNMDDGTGRPDTYIECFQFFLAPWDSAGEHPKPARAPDAINNSWGCTIDEGCDADNLNIIKTATANLRSAGIFVAASAGNSGSGCASISEPAAIYNVSTTVGATDSADALASFSSRGPVSADGSNRRKPDISAPGVSVRSSVPGNSYAYLSGTSMASPHVAGAVALLWNAVPSLRGKIYQTEQALFNGAQIKVTIPGDPNQTCGGTNRNDIPNNLFGYGRLDVWKTYQNVQH